MSSRFSTLCLCGAFAALCCGPAAAQDIVPIESPASPSLMDVADLWRIARHKDAPDAEAARKFFVIAPSIGSKPSTGLNAGLAGNVAFFQGNTDTTHISSVSGGLKVSQKGQTLSGMKFAVFTDSNKWFVQGDNRLSLTSQNTYGLGSDTGPADSANVKYDLFRLYESVYRNVGEGLYIGAGLNFSAHTNIRPGSSSTDVFDDSAYLAYSSRNGFTPQGQTSAGPSVGLIYDTRDNAINAQRGWLASASYRTFFEGFLGGDSTWQELYVDVRTYRNLEANGRQRLAFWFLSDMVVGGTAPYLDLPTSAGDTYGRSARGYSEGRYRGEHLAYGEVEYRNTLTQNGLLGFVAFVNTTTIGSVDAGTRLFDTYAPGAGFGFRVLLNKRSRTNLCTDYGWGKDGSRGFYLSIQEAF
jgi:outer membrane protein assembly factor BamA